MVVRREESRSPVREPKEVKDLANELPCVLASDARVGPVRSASEDSGSSESVVSRNGATARGIR